MDLSQYLEEGDYKHDTIAEAEDDEYNAEDATGEPIFYADGPKVGAGRKDIKTADIIDPDITTGDMMTLIYSEIQRKKVAGHHIDSLNSFYRTGIKQIATKVFVVEGRMRNLRDKTEEDLAISEIIFKVEFTDINLSSPTTIKYKSGAVQMVYPSMCRLKGTTYSCSIHMDAKITATAVYKNGHTKTRTAELKNRRIGAVPCAVGTEVCNTYNCSRETLKNLEEDPEFPGGCFIIKGHEWVISNLENTANNTFHVHKNMYMNEIVRGNFLSKPGDAFENSYQIIIRYLTSGAITVEISPSKDNKIELPYYVLFRALGMTRDYEIVDNIVYGVENQDTTTRHMLEILERAFKVEDKDWAPVRRSTDPAEIVEFIGQKLKESSNTAAAKKDDNVAKYLNTNFLSIVDRYFLPHIGVGVEHRIRKLRFLGHLINKLLGVFMGIIESTDRDHYGTKRIYAAGTSVAKSFKTDFNFTVVQPIKKQLIKDFKNTPFSNVQLAESVSSAINSDELERLLMQSITSGNKTITVKRNEITNRVSSQTLYHKNDLNVKSTLGTINTPNTSASKQNERADEMRRVHPSFPGFVDVTQSADTGEQVGIVKQMACMASICSASSSFVMKSILLEDPDIIKLDDTTPAQISAERLSKVFVGGDWIGCCRNAHELARKYRELRRGGKIHHYTTIDCKLLVREIYFWTDLGRCMRPLVIVYNNIEEYIDNWRNGDRSVKFRQWIRLNRDHIRGLQAGRITMDDLREAGVIEYISPDEQENAFLSTNINNLRQNEGNLRRMYTHCDIDQAIFGIITLASPMPNHSSATRNTYYTNHRKQSAGWFALNYPFRIDKNTTLQHYCERPLISTFSDMLTYPNGQNAIIALIIHSGKNQEDSTDINGASVDCGMFNASFYTYEKAELEKNEQFGNPDYARTMDIKRGASYEHIVNGFIAEGTLVHKDDVLIPKCAKLPKPIGNYQYVDRSVVYKKDEPVIVERVIVSRNDEDALVAKVKLRADRPIGVGDKVSSRTGNKGICAAVSARSDMPYCASGLIPDALVNAHSIPTRMAINQMIESLLGVLAAKMGTHIDATAFRDMSVLQVLAILKKDYGLEFGGYERMYNGRTGDPIDTLIFCGPTTYQRLQKFVIDEHYAIRSGPTTALLRQPTDGKNNDGGLRIGEMEKDCMCAHGSMRALSEKMYTDSDGVIKHFCANCGNEAVVNERRGLYKCKRCGDNADIVKVPTCWAASVFFNESNAMNVRMEFDLAPHTYAAQ